MGAGTGPGGFGEQLRTMQEKKKAAEFSRTRSKFERENPDQVKVMFEELARQRVDKQLRQSGGRQSAFSPRTPKIQGLPGFPGRRTLG